MRDFSSDHSALSLNTATLGHNLDGYGAGWSPERIIDACAERGFGGITFWRRELGGRAYLLGRRVIESGMRVSGLCRAPYFTGRSSGSDFEIKSSIEDAAALGSDVLTVVSGGIEVGTLGIFESQRILIDRLSLACEFAGDCGVRLALEPLHPMFGGNRTCVMSLGDALSICESVGSEHLGIAVDVYHVWWDSGLSSLLERCGGLVLGYHLSDWLEDTDDILLGRGMMGDGVCDLRFIRSCLESSGYSGFCEVEVFSSCDWWLRDPIEVLDVIVSRFRSVC